MFLIGSFANAQELSYGGKITMGVSTINIGSSSESLLTLVNEDKCLKRFHISSKSGYSYSIGAVTEYALLEKIKVGINLNYLTTKFQVNTIHMVDEVNREIMNATNKISIGALNIPVYAKYMVVPEYNISLKIGGGLNILTNGKIKTTETLTTEIYNSTGTYMSSSSSAPVEYQSKLDYSKSINFFALFGVDLSLNENIVVGFDYILPFSKNSIYSSDIDYDADTHEGNIFTEAFINELKLDGNNLNEYKFGSLSLTFAYNL